MRHGTAGNRLGRNSSLRKATIRDIAKATLKCQRICTTKAKAKEARKLVDQLITLGKKGTLAHKRKAFAILCEHKLVSTLFEKMAPRFKQRNGGYTRIIPISQRRGDNAQLAYLELTEKEEVVVSKAKSRASSKKKAADVSAVKEQPKAGVDAGAEDKSSMKTEKGKKGSSKRDAEKDKGKSSKKGIGGIKRMFRRKTAE